MLLEGVLAVDGEHVAEEDRVGDLHHGRLEMQRDHQLLLLALGELLLDVRAQRLISDK